MRELEIIHSHVPRISECAFSNLKKHREEAGTSHAPAVAQDKNTHLHTAPGKRYAYPTLETRQSESLRTLDPWVC